MERESLTFEAILAGRGGRLLGTGRLSKEGANTKFTLQGKGEVIRYEAPIWEWVLELDYLQQRATIEYAFFFLNESSYNFLSKS